MKTLILSLTLLASGCTSHTSKGPCVGVLDQKVPGVKYELSGWNIFVGAVFCETLVVPAVVIAKQLECPQ